MEKVRTVIMGCGSFARASAPGILAHEAFDVVGIVNRGESNRKETGDLLELDPSKRFATAEEMFENVEADRACIFSNVGTHVDYCTAALEAGANISVTKPFTDSLAEGQQLAALAKEKGLWISVGQTARFGPINQTVKQAVDRGDIGQPGFANILVYRDRMQNLSSYQLEEDWPVINATAIHDYDYLTSLFNSRITRVSFRGVDAPWNPYRDPGVVAGWLEFDSGLVVNYFRSFVSRVYTAGGFPGFHSMIQGDKGALIWDAPWLTGEVKLHKFENPEAEEIKSLPVEDKDFTGQTVDYCQWLYESLHEGRAIFAPPEENLWVLAAVKASQVSAEQDGKIIDVLEFGKAAGLDDPQ